MYEIVKRKIPIAVYSLLLLLACAPLGFILWNYSDFRPTSYCVQYEEVYVFDSVVGESPKMSVDRVVNHPYRAKWIAEVEKLQDGKFVVLEKCTGRGENNYAPNNTVPKNLDLNWWIYPTICRLQPGHYRIETVWILQNYNKEIRVVSNVFEIKESPDARSSQ